MKFLIVFAALCAIAFAAPEGIVRQTQEVDDKGFKFEVETTDGTQHKAQGEVKDAGSEHETLTVQGQYSWVDEHGKKVSVTYTADEHGYQPQVSFAGSS